MLECQAVRWSVCCRRREPRCANGSKSRVGCSTFGAADRVPRESSPMIHAPQQSPKPLAGWRVLVPRGGPWGDGVAANLRHQGATPVVAPLINFAPTNDQAALDAALADLASGSFDWLTV